MFMKVQGWLGRRRIYSGCKGFRVPFYCFIKKTYSHAQLWALHTAFNRVTNNGIPKCFLLLGPYLRVCHGSWFRHIRACPPKGPKLSKSVSCPE